MIAPSKTSALGIASLALALCVASLLKTRARAEDLAARFDRADTDGDGRLSKSELPMPALFAAADKDRDGFVTRHEALEHFRDAPRRPEDAKGGVDEIFLRADRDGSGKVTPDEVPQRGVFERLDADLDGAITLAEARERLPALLAARGSGDKPGSKPAPPAKPEPEPDGPRMLKGTEHGIGRQVEDVAFEDTEGRKGSLNGVMGTKGLCIAFTSVTCPVSKRYLPAMGQLCEDLRAQGISLLVVNPMVSEPRDDLVRSLSANMVNCRAVHDVIRVLTRALEARTTTEVFLLDPSRTMVYRGALDDRYGPTYSREFATREHLKNAVAAMLAGTLPDIAATTAPGCELDLHAAAASATEKRSVTYHRDVARILQQNCTGCHHEGGLAPFALDTMAAVLDRAKTIKRVIEKAQMPPWFAAPSEDPGGPARWANDHSLSRMDREDLLGWIEGDRAEGNPADAPRPRAHSSEWLIGQPDAVFQLPKPVAVKAEGVMPYQNLVIETSLEEDKWVSAIEIRPTDREVVHHALVFVKSPGGKGGVLDRARAAVGGRRIAEDPEDETRGYFGIYVPGNSVVRYPDGFGRLLPKGSKLRFQMHYTPKGEATEDQTRIGFIFAKRKPDHVVQVAGISNPRLSIPPHASDHRETASLKVPVAVRVLAFAPHLHVRGKSFRYETVMPDGSRKTLLDVPRYDFNWQLAYRLASPELVPAGSRVEVTAVYDNSASNPANPDPNRTVRWGPQTFDEMLLGYMEYFVPSRPPAE